MLNLTDSTTPVTSGNFREMLQSTDSSSRPFNVLTGYNLGNNTLLLSVPMHLFYEVSAVANERGLADAGQSGAAVAQRKLDPKHATKLAIYILKGLLNAVMVRQQERGQQITAEMKNVQKNLGRQPYLSLQPIVANLRSCRPGGDGLRGKEIVPGLITVYLGDKDVIWVIDGQHRRFAMEMVFEFLKELKIRQDYPKRPKLYTPQKGHVMTTAELDIWLDIFEMARTSCKVMVELHLGLDSFQERQLFHDLNNLGKKIESSLAFAFDNSNPVNIFIKQELVESNLLNATVVERDIVDWHSDPGAISWKELTSVNAILFLNNTNIKGAKPTEVSEREDVAKLLWESVNKIEHFGQPSAKKLTVAAQPVVLKALAKLTYDFAFGRNQDKEHLATLLDGIPNVDFGHQNPMWRYYEFSELERDSHGLKGLADYLPPEHVGADQTSGANRDIGRFDPVEGLMRFGPKHNDIFPLLGDMIRWRLQLPSRRGQTAEAVANE